MRRYFLWGVHFVWPALLFLWIWRQFRFFPPIQCFLPLNSSIIHVYNLQACVLYLTIQKLSGECYVAETCSESFCCSVFYVSLRPLISFSFLFYPSIQVHPVIANTSCWFIVVPISTLCVSLSAEFNL